MAELTYQGFARMRTDVWRKRVIADGFRPLVPAGTTWDRFLEPIVPVTAHAGDWVRWDGTTSTGVRRKWHRFDGDLAWRPAYHGVQAGTACGTNVIELRREFTPERPAEDVCRRCDR